VLVVISGTAEEGTYLAIVPIAEFVLENLLLLGLKSLADAEPTATNGTGNIADATLVGEPLGNVLVGVTLLLEVDNAGVVGIVVGLDRLGPGGLASRDTNVAQVGELGALVGVLVVLLKVSTTERSLQKRRV
jgi:hypothetical protein